MAVSVPRACCSSHDASCRPQPSSATQSAGGSVFATSVIAARPPDKMQVHSHMTVTDLLYIVLRCTLYVLGSYIVANHECSLFG